MHNKEKPYKCEYCGKAFSNQSYLSDHMGMHRDSNLANYRLYIVDSAFVQHNEMLTDKNTCQCKYCDKASLVIVTYVYIWECIQERDNISGLIMKTNDISGTLDPLLDSSESAP